MKRLIKISVLATLTTLALSAPALASDLAAGEAVYNKACKACHGMGVMGAPKLGDHEDWEKRMTQGMPTLIEHSVKGFKGEKGMMPAKGGNASLTDQEVEDAVAYMVSKAKH